MTLDVINFSAAISACEKGEQWQRALSLLKEMRLAGATLIRIPWPKDIFCVIP